MSFSIRCQAGAHGVLGKRGLRASCSFSSAWTEAVQGQISLSDASRQLKTLELSVACGRHNLNLSTSLSSMDKVEPRRLEETLPVGYEWGTSILQPARAKAHFLMMPRVSVCLEMYLCLLFSMEPG